MNAARLERWFRKKNPDFRYRHEIYNDILIKCLAETGVWLDIGCGRNQHVAELGHHVDHAIGIDVASHPGRVEAPFLEAGIRSLPLPSDYADLVTLRMVVEHLEKFPDDLLEVERVLKPGGKLIVLTTNAISPIIFIPRILPYRLKEWMIRKSLGVPSEDTFPTYHRFNTPGKFRKGVGRLKSVDVQFIEQFPFSNLLMMAIFGTWYLLTKPTICASFRSNILGIFQKESA